MIDHARRDFARRLGGAVALLSATPAMSFAARDTAAPGAGARAAALVAAARQLLAGLAAPTLAPFLAAWPVTAARRDVSAASLPVLRWLTHLEGAAVPATQALVRAVVAAAPELRWRQTYTRAEVGAEFLDNYGWTELAGLTGPVPSQHLACGLLLLGPGTRYPQHRHEADEIYVPLAGTAEWRQGSGDWREQEPGTVIHHARDVPHAMRTATTPLLALYLWLSDDLAQKAHLDAPQPG